MSVEKGTNWWLQAAKESAKALGDVTQREHQVCVVLGSGLGAFADELEDALVLEARRLPHFTSSSVPGHASKVVSGRIGGTGVLVLSGRSHLYEGHPVGQVVHPVRVAAAAGCTQLVLTNAAGGLDPNVPVGTLVMLSDHLNLTGENPLTGRGVQGCFLDMTDAYSPRLQRLVHQIDPSVPTGVYAALRGPSYETPAEVQMVRRMGADLVGMSTVLETIAARHQGLEVAAFSLVTNHAAGLQAALSHEEVTLAGKGAAKRVTRLLRDLCARIGDEGAAAGRTVPEDESASDGNPVPRSRNAAVPDTGHGGEERA